MMLCLKSIVVYGNADFGNDKFRLDVGKNFSIDIQKIFDLISLEWFDVFCSNFNLE
jgi:hypothetical protein